MLPKSLPVELWQQVVCGIDSRRDLLSLALVSRTLSLIILPHHLPFCHIRCDVRRKYVWEYLSAHPLCAQAVRRLDIVIGRYDTKLRLPPALSQSPPDYSPYIPSPAAVSALVKALSYMSSMSIFTWRFTNADKFSDVSDISHALLNAPIRLHALTLYQFGFSEDANLLPIWQLCSLVRVILHEPCESAQEMLIQRCPNLEDLSLSMTLSRGLSIFKHGSWKKLRRLSLSGSPLLNHLPVMERETIMADFFQRQPNLESLMSTADLPLPPLPDSSLQMLRSVSLDLYYYMFKPSFSLSKSVLSNLVHYKTNGCYFDHTVQMSSLETLQFASSYKYDNSDLADIVKSAPNLRKINILGSLSPMDIKRWVAALASYSQVTHVFLSTSLHPNEAERIMKQFSRIKTLQYMQLYVVNPHERHPSRLCEVIKRNSSGKLIRHHDVVYSKSETGAPPSEWGDYFVGL